MKQATRVAFARDGGEGERCWSRGGWRFVLMSLEASFAVALLTRRLGSCLTGRSLSTQAPPGLSTRGLPELGEMPYANGL